MCVFFFFKKKDIRVISYLDFYKLYGYKIIAYVCWWIYIYMCVCIRIGIKVNTLDTFNREYLCKEQFMNQAVIRTSRESFAQQHEQ